MRERERERSQAPRFESNAPFFLVHFEYYLSIWRKRLIKKQIYLKEKQLF